MDLHILSDTKFSSDTNFGIATISEQHQTFYEVCYCSRGKARAIT